MLIEKDVQKILSHLTASEDPIRVAFDGSDIFIRFLEDASKLHLTTSVYYGGNYIPNGVRRCLSHKTPLPHPTIPTIPTYLTVDEQHFQIHLNYLGQIYELTTAQLRHLIEEFGWIAENWRLYLDENDKNDLIYVRVK